VLKFNGGNGDRYVMFNTVDGNLSGGLGDQSVEFQDNLTGGIGYYEYNYCINLQAQCFNGEWPGGAYFLYNYIPDEGAVSEGWQGSGTISGGDRLKVNSITNNAAPTTSQYLYNGNTYLSTIDKCTGGSASGIGETCVLHTGGQKDGTFDLNTAGPHFTYVFMVDPAGLAQNSTISSGGYDPASGLVTLTLGAAPSFSAGALINVSSLTGTGAFASLDGGFYVTNVSGATVTYQAQKGLGAATLSGGSVGYEAPTQPITYAFNTGLVPGTSQSADGTGNFEVNGDPPNQIYQAVNVANNTLVVNLPNITGIGNGAYTLNAAILYFGLYTISTLHITDNFVSPSGALNCITTTWINGLDADINGTIGNGSGGAGDILTVTSITGARNNNLAAGARIYGGGIPSSGPGSNLIILPYGTGGTSGIGWTGSYIVYDLSSGTPTPANLNVAVSNASATGAYGTIRSDGTFAPGTLTISGNINLLSTATTHKQVAITVAGPLFNQGQCFGKSGA
jgi:hypothetical protein